MVWPEKRLTDWNHFLAIVNHLDFGPIATFPYVFRGQGNASWTLKPSLTRVLPPACDDMNALQIEEDCRVNFAEQAHLHIPRPALPGNDRKLEWWSLMQHHRAPTRLLDWTKSPFVASYFAAVEHWDRDGAIWLFHPKTVLNQNGARAGVHVELPSNAPQRLVVQQGVFVYHDCVLTDLEEALGALLNDAHQSLDKEVLRKIVVPKELKPEILRRLRLMNITGASLFPGIDGLGYSALELARLSGAYPRYYSHETIVVL